MGVGIQALLSAFTSTMPLFSRPFWRIKRTLARTYFEQAMVGTVATFTDRYLRDPSTGLRYDHRTGLGGISALGALVIGESFDWGGGGAETGGDVELMVVPRLMSGAYVPCAQVDDTATTAGYVDATKTLTCYAHEHSESSEVADATRFVAGDKVRIIEIDPAVAASADSWDRTVASQTGNTIVLTVALSAPAWDTAKKYRVVYQGYAASTTTQQAHVYQADDADGLIADTRQAYELITAANGQSPPYTNETATAVPARHSTLYFGDGAGLDVGAARDAARLANSILHYKGAPQTPQVYADVRYDIDGDAGSGYIMVEHFPKFVQMGRLAQFQTRKLYVAPQLASLDGSAATVRISLLRSPPGGDERVDIIRPTPYREVSFSTSSTAYSVPAAQGLDIRHLRLGDGTLGGVGWIMIEVTSKATYLGLARCYLGPVETP